MGRSDGPCDSIVTIDAARPQLVAVRVKPGSESCSRQRPRPARSLCANSSASWMDAATATGCADLRGNLCGTGRTASEKTRARAWDALRSNVKNEWRVNREFLLAWQTRRPTVALPLSQLDTIDGDESIKEGVGDWHYWVA